MNDLQERLAGLSQEQRDQLIAKLAMSKRARPDERVGASAAPAEPAVPMAPETALSPAQQRMWLFEKMEGSSSAYNIATVLRVRGALDVDALEWSINDIVRRHEILRTRFIEVDGQAKQEVAQEVEFRIQRISVDADRAADDPTLLDAAIAEQVGVSFCLERGPLLRVSVIVLRDDEAIIVSVLHHIIADGWSLRLLERELSRAYADRLTGTCEAAPAHAVQYRDYVRWQRQWLREGAARQLDYWKSQLEGAPGCWPMPCEQPREATTDLRASSLMIPLSAALCDRVRSLAESERASAFMVLAAAFKLVLGHFAGTRDISIGTPVANRREQRFDPVIGLFSNTVVLRSRRVEGTFRDYLQQIKAIALGAFSNQDLPFEQVVDALRPERSTAYPPLFQVLFALQSTEGSELSLPGLDVQPVHTQRSASEFDLIFEFFLSASANHALLTYRSALHAGTTIQRMQDCFVRVLEQAVSDPDTAISDLMMSLAATPVAGTGEASGVSLLNAHCPLVAGDRVLLGHGLPEGIAAAAQAWSIAGGASSHGTLAIDAGPEHVDALVQRLCEAKPTVLVLSPGEFRSIRQVATDASGPLDACRLILVHGDTPAAATQVSGAAVWQCWGDPHGPYLLRRTGNGDTIAAHRGVIGCVNALDEALPHDVIGELTWAPMPGAAAVATGLRGRLTGDGVRLDGFIDTHGWIDGHHIPLDQVEAALLRIPAVSSAAVVARADLRGVWRLIAYVVVSRRIRADAIDALLRSELDAAWVPSGYVALNRIPCARDGRVDVAALAQFAVLDDATRASFAVSLGRALDEVGVEWVGPPRPADIAITRPVPIALDATSADDADVSRDDAPAALAEGPPLSTPTVKFSLADLLAKAARDHGEHGITYLGAASGDGVTQTYAELLEEATRVMAGLRARGSRPGERVLLQLADSRRMLTGFWACVLCGLTPILVAVPGSQDADDKDLAKIVNAWSTLSVSLVLTSAVHRDIVAALARGVGQPEFPCACIEDLSKAAPEADWHVPVPDETALLLLTSGSTGAPKAVIQSHRALVSHVAANAQEFGFDDSAVTFNWMPLDHVGGIVMLHLLDVHVGANQVQCPTALILEQPLRWLEWMSRYRATKTWAPNFAYALINGLLAEQPLRGLDLSALALIFNGGESVVPRTARAFLNALAPYGLRSDAMLPVWGMSETSSGVIFNRHFSPDTSSDEDSFVEVGAPLPGLAVRIVDANDLVVQEGRDGRLQIRGAAVTSGYLNNEEATGAAFTADGWYKTGDLAVLRDGQLTITGREKDLIIVNGLNYYGHEIEQIVETVPDVLEAHVAACGVRRADDDTDRLAIFFSVQESAQGDLERIRGEIRQAVLARAQIPATYLIAMAPDELPRTSIGKIQRPQLVQRFGHGEFDARLESGQNGVVVPDWFLEPAWQAAPRAARRSGVRHLLLIVGDDNPFAMRLAQALSSSMLSSSALSSSAISSGRTHVVTASFGSGFAQVSDDAFVVEAGDSGHYARLLERLQARSPGPWHIVHCGACRPGRSLSDLRAGWGDAHHGGLLSLVALARAIALAPTGLVCALDVASHGAFAVGPVETPVVEHGTLQGFLRSLAQELPGLSCRQVDVGDLSANAVAALLSEIGSQPTHDTVALRDGRRFVQGLRACDLPAATTAPAFPGPGICLISGGLGGIGNVLSEWLLRYTDRHVLLLGRTDLADMRPDDTEMRSKELAHDRLARYGARFAYAALDVCDGEGMRALIEDRQHRWGVPLRQVFHLAGTLRAEAIGSEDGEAFLASMRAKSLGAVVLHEMLQSHAEVEIVHFGSINGFFGGAGLSAYAASNSFLDALVAHRRSQGGAARCLSWSMWGGIGMSREHDMSAAMSAQDLKSLSEMSGYAVLDVTQGTDSFGVASACGRPSVLIGVDPSNPNIARFMDAPAAPYWQLRVRGEAPDATLQGTDAFGTSFTACDDTRGSAAASQTYETPVGEVESAIAQVWQELLGLERVGRHDHFFELGGHSLLVVQMISRLRQQLSVEVAMRDVFAQPTVMALAGVVNHASRAMRPSMVVSDRSGGLPLSWSQQRLWFLDQLDHAASVAYHIPTALRLRGVLNRLALQQTLNRIVARHENLRTTFVTVDGRPQQVIASDSVGFALSDHDLSHLDEKAQAEALTTALSMQEAEVPFDLSTGPLIRGRLLRLSAEEHVLLVTQHHIISDAWSIGVLVREVSALYAAFIQGQADPLPALTIQYADYAAWQRQWLQGEVLQQQLAFWREHLTGAPTLLELPTDRPRPPVQSHAGGVVPVQLSAELTAGLRAISKRHGTTVFMTLLAGWSALLSRLSGQSEVVIGTPVANRQHAEVEGLIGFFVNTLALRVDLGPDPRVSELLSQVKGVTLGGSTHQDVPFEQVVEALQPARSLGHSPLFQVMLTLDNTPSGGGLQLPGLTLSPVETPHVTTHFDLSLLLVDAGEGMAGGLEYASALFDRETVTRYVEQFTRVLEAMVANADQRISELPLLSQSDRHRLLVAFNDTARAYPRDGLIHGLFEAQVARSPEATALVYEAQTLSYAALNRRSNQVAHRLLALGVKPDDRVAICAERSVEMVVGLLGILKAGGAYVPLDPGYPAERLAYMLSDSAPVALLTQTALLDAVSSWLPSEQSLPVVVLDGAVGSELESQPMHNPAVAELGSGHLAYVIYTSGSTGQPKGVMVEHAGLCNLAVAQRELLAVDCESRMLQFASFSFDASVYEITIALCSGASLCLASRDDIMPGDALLATLHRHGVTHVTLPQSALQLCEVSQAPTGLTLIVAGEALPPALAQRWAGQQRLFNAYGPSETTVCASAYLCQGDVAGSVPIGRPIANTQIYILDERLQPVPLGVVGELYIGGAGVARGYLNRPALTAERFIHDPFSAEPHARMYKTGDLGRWLPDGNIAYVGRNDFQVKIRGFRIELGEIETKLSACASVREAVVIAREDVEGDKRLVAYVVPHAGMTMSAAELRESLSRELAEHMVPSAFVSLEALPLTPNGKLDRKALPAPDATAVASRAYEAPIGEVEHAIASIWQELLGLEQVGRHDHFFELGGHSLLAVQVVVRIQEVFNVKVSLKDMFESKSIVELGQFVSSAQLSLYSKEDINRLTAEIDELSDEELIRIWQAENQLERIDN
jgi:amino acid adenylation domain-containing protein